MEQWREHPGRWVIGLGWMVLVLTTGCMPAAPLWMKLEEATEPVAVKAIVTPNGNVLDRQKSLTYGPWQVSFGAEPPIAIARCSSGGNCEARVEPLTCTIPEHGDTRCSLSLDNFDEACALHREDGRESLEIVCPVDLVLDPPPRQGPTNAVTRAAGRAVK
ncbi:hypothetical protein [Candidatus Nitrospira bockiana]